MSQKSTNLCVRTYGAVVFSARHSQTSLPLLLLIENVACFLVDPHVPKYAPVRLRNQCLDLGTLLKHPSLHKNGAVSIKMQSHFYILCANAVSNYC